MKKVIFIIGIAAAVMAASCTKNDDFKTDGNGVFEGDKAYVVVNINDVGTASATKASSTGFKNGTSAEYAVDDAHFFFYDSDGVFVAEAKMWNSGKEVTGDGNIEFAGYTIVTLSGLTHTNYPDWLVTVLNEPDGFTAPATLEEFATTLASETEGIEGLYLSTTSGGAPTEFAMSTSSFVGNSTYGNVNVYTGTDGNTYYFATPVDKTNFTEEPITYNETTGEPNCTPVEIYVERLAAKVTLELGSLSNDTAQDGDGNTLYALTQTVITDDGKEDDVVYVRFEGWTLNATARKSNIVKAIDDSWTNTGVTDLGTGWDWNDPENYRSYWGKSWNYGLGYATEYPSNGSQGNTDADEAGDNALSDYLLYTSLTGDLNEFKDDVYCPENTNTAEIAALPSALTSILLKATVCDATGKGIDFIRHDGLLYTPEHYLSYALDHLPTVFEKSGSGTETAYTEVKTDILDFDEENSVDGYVDVIVKTDYLNTTYYAITENADGTVTENKSYTGSDLNTLLASFNENYGEDANYFNGGSMYYNIPIQHLNDDYAETNTDENGIVTTKVLEANYGVVRNHWYYVTINDLESLGKGIYKEGEVIVPTPEEPTYYIGAQVNILSWKYVSVGVVL